MRCLHVYLVFNGLY